MTSKQEYALVQLVVWLANDPNIFPATPQVKGYLTELLGYLKNERGRK